MGGKKENRDLVSMLKLGSFRLRFSGCYTETLTGVYARIYHTETVTQQ